MPKFGCRCGFVLNLVPYPNQYEHLLVPDASLEEAMMYLETREGDPDKFDDLLKANARQVLVCSNCGRLWVQEEAGGNSYRAYVKEQDE
jgi:hypothetical protein